jgi:type IV pilus assembly protein PilW
MNRKLSPRSRISGAPWLQSGFSLVELMVAITIGLLILAALLALFVNITRNNNELAKVNSQIENGRFAIQVLENDVVHAGFWGPLAYTTTLPMPDPTAIPNPCAAVNTWDPAYKQNLLAIPVQGFANGGTLGACNVAGVLASSDVLVVSHANTCTWGTAGCDGGADTGPHIQVSACQAGLPPEAMYVVDSANFPLLDKACAPGCAPGCATKAARRKIVTNIYYLATSNNLPTLMRVSLVNGAYTNPPQPLIEGIEAFHVEYGIDTLGRNGLPISATNPGDGSADSYVSCAPCTLNQLANIVAVKIYVLARNLETTLAYTDTKAYQLGGTAIPAKNDGFKRHVFSTTVRLVNPSGRREQAL